MLIRVRWIILVLVTCVVFKVPYRFAWLFKSLIRFERPFMFFLNIHAAAFCVFLYRFRSALAPNAGVVKRRWYFFSWFVQVPLVFAARLNSNISGTGNMHVHAVWALHGPSVIPYEKRRYGDLDVHIP